MEKNMLKNFSVISIDLLKLVPNNTLHYIIKMEKNQLKNYFLKTLDLLM